MSTIEAVIATRSGHKLREIQQILTADSCLRLVTLGDLDIAETGDEDGLERFETFAENARAKARHFVGLTGLPTIADDSGICIEALGGAPGVRSKRFSNRPDLSGDALDEENNRRVLELLADVPDGLRAAYYVCVAAVVFPDGREHFVEGRCYGRILREPRGTGGFGYDPLFLVDGGDLTFGELQPERKNKLSHRAHAFRELERTLCR